MKKRATLWLMLCLGMLVGFSGHADKSGVAPNVLVLPQGPGSLGGVGENVRGNLNMGLMSYSVKEIQISSAGKSDAPDADVSAL